MLYRPEPSIQDVNEMVKINNRYLSVDSEYLSQSLNIYNPKTLMAALKNRNQKYHNSSSSKKNVVNLSQPLRNLSDRVRREISTNYAQILQEKNRQPTQFRQIPFETFTLSNQSQFLRQYENCMHHKNVARTLKVGAIEKRMKTAFIDSLLGLNEVQKPERKQKKQNKDIQTIEYLSVLEKKHVVGLDINSILDDFSNISSISKQICYFWRVLADQKRSYREAIQSKSNYPRLAIYRSSLNFIESSFRIRYQNLVTQQSINKWIKQNQCYDKLRQGQYEMNDKGMLIWGIPYFYLRSHNLSKLKSSLNNIGKEGREISALVDKFFSSLEGGNPTPQRCQYKSNDFFYKKIVDILTGNSQVIKQINSLHSPDFIWTLIMCIMIYEEKEEQKRISARKVGEVLLRFYQDQILNKKMNEYDSCLHFLLLGQHSNIASLKKDQRFPHLFTADEYFHYLLALIEQPQIMSPKQLSDIEKVLPNQFKLYISKLLNHPNLYKYAIYYILEIPVQFLDQIIKSVCNTWEKFEKINSAVIDETKGWRFIKAHFSLVPAAKDVDLEKITIDILNNLLQVQQSCDVVEKLFEQAKELVNDQETIYEMFLKRHCQNLVKISKSDQIRSALLPLNRLTLSLLSEILREMESQKKKKYKQAHNFLQYYDIFSRLRWEKQFRKLNQELKDEKYVYYIQSSYRSLKLVRGLDQLFTALQQCDSLQIFFIYIRELVFVKEKLAHLRGNFDNLRIEKKNIVDHLNTICKEKIFAIEGYRNYWNF